MKCILLDQVEKDLLKKTGENKNDLYKKIKRAIKKRTH